MYEERKHSRIEGTPNKIENIFEDQRYCFGEIPNLEFDLYFFILLEPANLGLNLLYLIAQIRVSQFEYKLAYSTTCVGLTHLG